MSTVPRYDLQRLVATGGMGKVWAAHDTVLDREVAVKVLKDEYADDRHFRDRFAAEARHAARLQHPNVAAVLDYGELPTSDEHPTPRPFLVMELVDGDPLSALLQDGEPMPAETAADIIGQAATGIAAAHEAGIVHRDVKPGNLLVTPEGVVKVTDFGIARAADGVPLTATGHVMGTPHYLSPEQAEGQAVTPASDVYGLGIVLFECLAGHKPFRGDNPVVTALQHVNDPLPPLPDDVPSWLRSVVERATAKDPAQRYPEAGALAKVLKEGKGEPAGAAPGPATALLTSVSQAAAQAGTRVSQTTTSRPDTPARRNRPWGVILASLAALVLGVLLVMALLDQTGDPAETVQVDRADYVGRPYDEAAGDLDDAGLEPSREERDNPGGRTPETVSGVRPTGEVEEGSAVVLTVWGPAPETTQEPEPSPEPQPTPDEPQQTKKTKKTEQTEQTEETSPTVTTPTESDTSGTDGSGSGLGGGQ